MVTEAELPPSDVDSNEERPWRWFMLCKLRFVKEELNFFFLSLAKPQWEACTGEGQR